MPTKSSPRTGPLWPTILDYGIFILLAIITAVVTLTYLTREELQTVNQPSQKLSDVTKP
jgi:hypothetical protein